MQNNKLRPVRIEGTPKNEVSAKDAQATPDRLKHR
jgi:hypothetical protein